jgi:hypothetical protein
MTKYYIRHAHTYGYGRATSMEKQLFAFCRAKVGIVMSERRLQQWIDEIRQEQDRIKAATPRIKAVDISVNRAFGSSALSSIRIGEGYIGLDVVKGEEA